LLAEIATLPETPGVAYLHAVSRERPQLEATRDNEQGKSEPTLRRAVRLAGALGAGLEVFADSAVGADDGAGRRASKGKASGRPRKEK
jgi:hypothetical protein